MTKNLRRNRGVTLIALVMSVIIILILAAISLNFVIGENGLMTRAAESKKKMTIANYEERLEFIAGDEKVESIVENGPFTRDVLREAIIREKTEGREKWIAEIENDETDEKEQTIIVTSNEGYIFYVVVEDGKVTITYEGQSDGLGPVITKVQLSSTSYSLTVSCKVLKLGTGTIKYSYATTEEGPYTEYMTTTEQSCEITDLESNVRYYIKIEAENDKGRDEKITNGVTVSIYDLTAGQATFTYNPSGYTNGDVEVGIDIGIEGYKVQYSLEQTYNEENSYWLDYTQETTFTITKNQTIWGRFVDDGGNVGYIFTGVVSKIDKLNPKGFTIAETVTTNSITISASTEDEEATSDYANTGIRGYQYSIDGGSTWSNETATLSNNTITDLVQNAPYTVIVRAYDNVGNYTESSKVITTKGVPGGNVVDTGVITFGSVTWSGGYASTTISTSETEYTLQYQIGSTGGSWTTITSGAAVGSISTGTTIYARLIDNSGQEGAYATLLVKDSVIPQTATISLGSTNITTAGNTTATVTHIDNESGVNIGSCKWILSTTASAIGTSAGSYTGTFSTNPQTITLSNTTPGTYYLHVLTIDVAGNARETISSAITIRQLVTGITLSKTSTTLAPGATDITTATITPANATNKAVTWSTSNAGIATVSNGTITAVGSGTATITCTAADGSGIKATCSVTVNKVLKLGDYVNYTVPAKAYTVAPAQSGADINQSHNTSSYTGTWNVLTISGSTVNLISEGIIANIFMGGKTGYNSFVSTLNTVSGHYVNTTYATSGRSVGSNPSNPAGTTASTYYGGQVNGQMINADTTYTTDVASMTAAGVMSCGVDYWLASRSIYDFQNGNYEFQCRTVWDYGGGVTSASAQTMGQVTGMGTQGDDHGVRPVITLKSTVKFVDSGTTKNGRTVWNLSL